MSIGHPLRLSLYVVGLSLLVGGRGEPAQLAEDFSLAGGALQGEADRVEADAHHLLLQGRALLNLQVPRNGTLAAGLYRLQADRIGVDLKEERAEAVGNVSLQTPQGQIQAAQQAQFDLLTRRGHLQEVHLFYPDDRGAIFSPRPEDLLAPEEVPTGLWLYAQRADYAPEYLSLHRTYLVPAGPPYPPYSLRAEVISLQGLRWGEIGQARKLNWSAMRLQLRRVSGYWGHRKLFTLPDWTLSGERAERDLLWLNLGYTSVEGFYTRIREGASWGRGWRGDLNLRLGTKNGLTGTASLSRKAGEGLFRLGFTRQERVPDRLASEARVSRWPEGSYTWTRREAQESSSATGARTFSLQLSAGRYEDLHAQRRTERANVTFAAYQTSPRWGKVTGTWGGRFSQSWYGTGERFSVWSTWAGLDCSWEARNFVRALYRTHRRRGRTPLPSLDEVDIPHELQITVNTLVDHHWFVGLQGRYNLPCRDFEEVEYTLARRLHLIQYGLTWRHQPDSRFNLHLRVLGF